MKEHNLSLVLFLTAVVLVSAPLLWGIVGTSEITPESVVRNYLALMAAGKFTKVLDDIIENTSVGMNPPQKDSGMSLEEAEAKGLVGEVDKESARRHALEVLARQRDYVIEEFGPKAWQNADFTLTAAELPPLRTVWRDKTGKEVDEKTAMSMLDSFWEEVASVEGINPRKVLGLANNIPPEMEPAEFEALRARAISIQEKYLGQLPVSTSFEPIFPGYLVTITFGDGVSKSGASNFTVFLSKRSGTWKLSTFQWEPKFPEPEGDI